MNCARRDLCGGCSVMGIPTAIHRATCNQIGTINSMKNLKVKQGTKTTYHIE